MPRVKVLTIELIQPIAEAVAHRIPTESVASSIGISRQTLWGWLRKGREDREAGVDSIERDLVDSIEGLKSQVLTESFKGWKKSAIENNDWRAHKALIEKIEPSLRDETTANVKVTGGMEIIQLNPAELTDDQLKAILARASSVETDEGSNDEPTA